MVPPTTETAPADAPPGEALARATPWWAPTLHLAVVVAFGLIAVAWHADPRLVAFVAVMACAALRWNGPWPTITFGGKRDAD